MNRPGPVRASLLGLALLTLIVLPLGSAFAQTGNSATPPIQGLRSQPQGQPAQPQQPVQQQTQQPVQQQTQQPNQQGQPQQIQSGQQQNQTGTRQNIPNDAFVDQVKAKMDSVQKVLTSDGFERTHNRHYAKVNKGESEETVLTLNADVQYAIVTVCDNDCSNVDAKLYSNDNQELDMDTTSDDFPVLEIKPLQTGEYKIVVSVPGCSAKRCTIGIGIYGKNGATPANQ